jgi:sugar phosphate isomerase/epimerase
MSSLPELSRRSFLARTSAAALATLSSPSVEAARAPFGLHYVLASSLYGKLPLKEILPEVAAVEARGIDLWPMPHGSQREEVDTMGVAAALAMLQAADVRCQMSTRYDLGPFRLESEIKVLKELGGGTIVCGGAGPAGLTGVPLKEAVKEFAQKLQPTVALAEKHNVRIAIENHGKNLIDSPNSLRWLIEFVPSAAIGIALAPYHLPQEERAIADLIKDLGRRLHVFYAWQHGNGSTVAQPKEQELAQLPGRGRLDFTPLLSALRDIQYSGITEIFMHPFPRGIPILPTIPEVRAEINRARTYLDGIVARLNLTPP